MEEPYHLKTGCPVPSIENDRSSFPRHKGKRIRNFLSALKQQ
jgi:hypothetical protein